MRGITFSLKILCSTTKSINGKFFFVVPFLVELGILVLRTLDFFFLLEFLVRTRLLWLRRQRLVDPLDTEMGRSRPKVHEPRRGHVVQLDGGRTSWVQGRLTVFLLFKITSIKTYLTL